MIIRSSSVLSDVSLCKFWVINASDHHYIANVSRFVCGRFLCHRYLGSSDCLLQSVCWKTPGIMFIYLPTCALNSLCPLHRVVSFAQYPISRHCACWWPSTVRCQVICRPIGGSYWTKDGVLLSKLLIKCLAQHLLWWSNNNGWISTTNDHKQTCAYTTEVLAGSWSS